MPGCIPSKLVFAAAFWREGGHGERSNITLRLSDFTDAFLRVFVVGGGCSGFQYGMSIAESAEDTDRIIDLDEVSVVIDKDSVPMISGAEIDYVEDLMKSGFTIHNPNAVSSCACGSSFQTSDGAGVARPCS